MAYTSSQPYFSLQQLEEILPAEQLKQIAIDYNVDRRNQIRLPGIMVLLCLLNAILNHENVTQRILEETYRNLTGRKADHSTFGKRLGKIPSEYFEAVFAALFQRLAPKITRGDVQSLRLRFVDATIVNLSAKLIGFGLLYQNTGQTRTGKAHRSIKSVFELTENGLPRFLRLALHKSENSDSVALGEAMAQHCRPHDLWVFDAGCHDRKRMQAIHRASAYFLTPHSTQMLNTQQVVWQASSDALIDHAPLAPEEDYQLVRVEQAIFGNTQDKSSKDKDRWSDMPLVVVHGLRWDKRKKAWNPLVLMTNLPLSAEGTLAGPYTFLELAQLYRCRWAIETFFKFLKQHLGYTHLVSRTENGVRVMIYASLIAALLLIWFKSVSQIDRGWRSVKFWLAKNVQFWTESLIYEILDRQRPPSSGAYQNRTLKKTT